MGKFLKLVVKNACINFYDMLIYLSNRKIIGGEPCAKYPTKKNCKLVNFA